MRLILLCLTGLLLFSAGCAQKQVAQLDTPSSPPKPAASGQNTDLLAAARSGIGSPYRFGGRSPETGFDCSGFVSWAYEQVGVQLPRRASEQATFGTPVKKDELQPGDIVAFKGTRGRTNWHSGIYTGNGKFIHSPNKGKTVTESRLDEGYFAQRFYAACRIPQDGSAESLYAAYMAKERETANAARSGKKAQAVATAKGKKGSKQTAKTSKTAKSSKTPKTAAAKTTNKAPAESVSSGTKTAAASSGKPSAARKDKKI